MATSRTFRLDMTRMYLMHDALRRELERIARVTARADGDPRRLMRTAVGRELFKSFLGIHHTAEDVALWPAAGPVAAWAGIWFRGWCRFRRRLFVQRVSRAAEERSADESR